MKNFRFIDIHFAERAWKAMSKDYAIVGYYHRLLLFFIGSNMVGKKQYFILNFLKDVRSWASVTPAEACSLVRSEAVCCPLCWVMTAKPKSNHIIKFTCYKSANREDTEQLTDQGRNHNRSLNVNKTRDGCWFREDPLWLYFLTQQLSVHICHSR